MSSSNSSTTNDQHKLLRRIMELESELETARIQLREWEVWREAAEATSASLLYRTMLLAMAGAPVDLHVPEEGDDDDSVPMFSSLMDEETQGKLPFLGGAPWPGKE